MEPDQLYLTEHPFTAEVDLSTKEFWCQSFDEREQAFAALRATGTISWQRAMPWPEPHPQQGYWAVTRAEHIAQVSMNNADFVSGYGVVLDPVDPAIAGMATFILSMDPPRHGQVRRLISAAFTPKAVARLNELIQQRAEQIVGELVGAGEIDFVRDCASRLPMQTVSDLVGVPVADRERLALAAERIVGGADLRGMAMEEAMMTMATEYELLLETGKELAAQRRAKPADDLMTNLVQAEIDGQGLSDDDIGAFLVLLSVAGNDTTKQTTSLGMLALQEHPDQKAWLQADFDARIGTAIEELVRWVTPVQQFSRTAARDVELAGQQIAAGDKVGIFYCSANRDPDLIEDPMRFDLSRQRNPHLGFGGGGAHFCLGNGLARTQLRAIFGQLLTRLPNLQLGSPVSMDSDFINGVISLPASTG